MKCCPSHSAKHWFPSASRMWRSTVVFLTLGGNLVWFCYPQISCLLSHLFVFSDCTTSLDKVITGWLKQQTLFFLDSPGGQGVQDLGSRHFGLMRAVLPLTAFFLCSDMADRAFFSSSSYKSTNLIIRASPSWPHVTLISKGQTLNTVTLGVKASTYEISLGSLHEGKHSLVHSRNKSHKIGSDTTY